MPFGLGFFAAGGASAATASFELIQTINLTGNTTSVTFSSIPQTYKHLQFRIVARGATTLSEIGTRRIAVRFSSDPTNSYDSHELFGNGNQVFSQSASSQTYIWGGYSVGDGVASGIYSNTVLDILDYSLTTKNKTTRALSGNHAGTNGQNNNIAIQSGQRRSLGAVSIIEFFVEGAPTHGFRSGSRFSLYGIR